jgi:hypothetical protein
MMFKTLSHEDVIRKRKHCHAFVGKLVQFYEYCTKS